MTKLDFVWRPALRVVLFYKHQPTTPIEALVDTGADHTFFHGGIGDALGIPVKSGFKYDFGGISSGMKGEGYFHKVRIQAAGSSYDTTVVFSYDISMAAILGQVGFFDHFRACFDWTPDPPSYELQWIQKN